LPRMRPTRYERFASPPSRSAAAKTVGLIHSVCHSIYPPGRRIKDDRQGCLAFGLTAAAAQTKLGRSLGRVPGRDGSLGFAR